MVPCHFHLKDQGWQSKQALPTPTQYPLSDPNYLSCNPANKADNMFFFNPTEVCCSVTDCC